MVMESNKSHDLPSTRWRTRKVNGTIQLESKGLIIRVGAWEERVGTDGVGPELSPKAQKPRAPMSDSRINVCLNSNRE